MLRKITICMVLALIAIPVIAQDTETEFPYKAQVIGQGVYVRSGSAIQYYYTMQLDEPAEVVVVEKRFSWCKIVPPKGSFSWIAKEFIMIDTEKPGYGILTNDNVRVWAGKAGLDPEDSTSPQGKLNKGDRVKLLGEESGDYYKIAPPADAYLWINGEYLKNIGRATLPTKPKPVVKPAPVKSADSNTTTPAAKKPAVAKKTEPAVVTRPEIKMPVKTEYEVNKIKEVYDIIKKIDAVRELPVADQNYVPFKQPLKAIETDKKAASASKYASYQLQRITGYELAIQAGSELMSQDKELMALRQQIAEKRKQMRDKVKKVDDYVVTGSLKKSLIYDAKMGGQRYLVVDEQGKILCYAIPQASGNINLSDYLGKKVGLRGNVIADQASGISLVKFTAVDVIDAPKEVEAEK